MPDQPAWPARTLLLGLRIDLRLRRRVILSGRLILLLVGNHGARPDRLRDRLDLGWSLRLVHDLLRHFYSFVVLPGILVSGSQAHFVGRLHVRGAIHGQLEFGDRLVVLLAVQRCHAQGIVAFSHHILLDLRPLLVLELGIGLFGGTNGGDGLVRVFFGFGQLVVAVQIVFFGGLNHHFGHHQPGLVVIGIGGQRALAENLGFFLIALLQVGLRLKEQNGVLEGGVLEFRKTVFGGRDDAIGIVLLLGGHDGLNGFGLIRGNLRPLLGQQGGGGEAGNHCGRNPAVHSVDSFISVLKSLRIWPETGQRAAHRPGAFSQARRKPPRARRGKLPPPAMHPENIHLPDRLRVRRATGVPDTPASRLSPGAPAPVRASSEKAAWPSPGRYSKRQSAPNRNRPWRALAYRRFAATRPGTGFSLSPGRGRCRRAPHRPGSWRPL